MIQQIIDFIKKRKIHTNNFVSLQERIKPIPINITNKRLYNYNEILNHIRNYRKITPEIMILITTMDKDELTQLIVVSGECIDCLVKTFLESDDI